MHDEINICTDGASRGNPGPASIGIVVYDEKQKELYAHQEFIGETTNNVAEYKAAIKALEIAVKYTQKNVRIFMDSLLVVEQLNRRWKIKTPHIFELFKQVIAQEKFFQKVSYTHIPREKNRRADALANKALDTI